MITVIAMGITTISMVTGMTAAVFVICFTTYQYHLQLSTQLAMTQQLLLKLVELEVYQMQLCMETINKSYL